MFLVEFLGKPAIIIRMFDFDLEYLDEGENISKNTVTVSEYINYLNNEFKRFRGRVLGEVSQVKLATSGHVYFTLKDKSGESSLECVVWSSKYRLSGVNLQVGMEVILTGVPNVYPARGSLSFVADTIELVGEGALKKAYDDLKRRLTMEGIFAPEKKRALPEFPKSIGVVTSEKGAVIHDFMNNLGHFGFEIVFIDSKVEGVAATEDILRGVRTLRSKPIDVLVMIRGGGSLESLQAYNNETLVREIASFPVPVIAGIGHDQDVPLMALAADAMCSTPTATAVLLTKPWLEAKMKVRQLVSSLMRVKAEIERMKSRFDLTMSQLIERVRRGMMEARRIIQLAEATVGANNPRRQLSLGYAIARTGGKIIRSVADIKPNDEITIELSDGEAKAKIQ